MSEPLAIIILFNLGLRIGGLCALQWGDIEKDRKGDYIHIQREMVQNIDSESGKARGFTILQHCKTPAGNRRLPLNSVCLETFKRIKRLNEERNLPTSDNDYIFVRLLKEKHELCTPRSFDPRLRRYCHKVGMVIEKSAHDARRTVLTNLYYAGMPLKQIQRFAGHSSLKQTMDYIRISDDEINIMPFLETLSAPTADGKVCEQP